MTGPRSHPGASGSPQLRPSPALSALTHTFQDLSQPLSAPIPTLTPSSTVP